MKRAAEAQLTRDSAELEQADQEDFRPFTQANEATLASRNIRSLPRRRGLGGHSTSGSPSPQAPPSFGLNQSMPSSTTESLDSTIVPTTTVVPFAFGALPSVGPVSNFSFKLPSSSSVPSTTLPTSSQPSTTPASSNPIFGHKPRASFSQPSTSSPLKKEITASPGGAPPSVFTNPLTSVVPVADLKPKSTFSFPTSNPGAAVNGTTSALSQIQASQAEVDYWKGLRGLNVSFLATARAQYEKDAFIDLSELFAGYCKIRNELNEKRRAVTASSAPSPTTNPTTTGGGFSFAGKSISLGSLAPPASTTLTTGIRGFSALTTGFSFGGKTVSFTSDSGSSAAAAAAGSSQSTTIDVDELERDKEDENMGEEIKEAESQQIGSSKFGVAMKEMKDGASGFSFGALPGLKPVSPFGGFGASSGSSDFKGFGTAQSTTTIGVTKQPFSFGLPPPGTTKPPEKDESLASIVPKPAFGFGLPPPGSTTALTRGATDAPASASSPTSEEKKPVGVGGFSFVNPHGWSSAKVPSNSNTGSGRPKPVGIGGSSLFTGVAGFGFGAVPPTPAGGTPGTETPAVQADGGTGGGEDHVPSSEQRYDVEGPGEEDEETIGGTSWRAKVWQLGKARGEDGKEKEGAGVEWVDFGVSFVRLKRHKATGSKRILARHSKTGHIVMNFAFFPQLSPKVADKAISFVGVANGKPASFRMKLQTAEQATQLLKTWKELIGTE